MSFPKLKGICNENTEGMELLGTGLCPNSFDCFFLHHKNHSPGQSLGIKDGFEPGRGDGIG